MTLVPWKHGRELVWDIDTLVQTRAQGCASKAGSTAATAERKEVIKYQKLCDGLYHFALLVF